MKKLLVLICNTFLFVQLHAQNKQIIIETKNTALVLSVGSNLRVTQSYLGKKFTVDSEYSKLPGGREVYLTAGMENQNEAAIRMIHNDGNPSLELQYLSHSSKKDGNITTTTIITRDPVYPVEVILYYSS